MKDHHHLAKYNIELNKYTTLTGFDERALYAKYYKGFATRIKDGLAYSGRPSTLSRLRERTLAVTLRAVLLGVEDELGLPCERCAVFWVSAVSMLDELYHSWCVLAL